MAEEVKTTTVAVAPKTEQQLLDELGKAYAKKDFAEVRKIASELAKFQKETEKAEEAAKEAALVKMTAEVKAVLDKALAPLIASKRLDKADGVWYANDFGEKLTSCRLSKGKATHKGGGGGGKKFDVSTDDLLKQFGGSPFKVEGKDTAQTIKAAYDSNTDGNFRYKIRTQLLKLAGKS